MTKDDAVPVTAEHRNAAADLIEAYWQGAGEQHDQMRELAARYRAGHSQGVWTDAFARFERDILARHRGSTAVVDEVRDDEMLYMRGYLKVPCEVEPEGERREALQAAAMLLAPYSADPSGTPTRDGLVFLNAAVSPGAAKYFANLASLSQSPATPMVQEGLREAAQAVVDESARMTMTMRRRKIFDALAAALADRTQEGEVRP